MGVAKSGSGRGACPTRAATNSACAALMPLSGGCAIAPVMGEGIAVVTCSAWAMVHSLAWVRAASVFQHLGGPAIPWYQSFYGPSICDTKEKERPAPDRKGGTDNG